LRAAFTRYYGLWREKLQYSLEHDGGVEWEANKKARRKAGRGQKNIPVFHDFSLDDKPNDADFTSG
jgi:hypothetical protein